VLAAARSLHELVWWWWVGPRLPWLTWTFRGLGIFGYVGLLGLVILLSSEGSGRPNKRRRRSKRRAQKKSWNWKGSLDWGLWIIPIFVFSGFVLIEGGPILGVMFLIVAPVALFEALTLRHDSQPDDRGGASRDVGGA
jgi:hypothetical protein